MPQPNRLLLIFALSFSIPAALGLLLSVSQPAASAPVVVGDPLPRIQCGPGYTATVYAEGLSGPDGLALNSAGELFVAEETAHRVTQIGAGGILTPVMTGLTSPEGIAFDAFGNLYAVEDVKGGRVVRLDPNGLTSTVVGGLDSPEGIVWVNSGSVSGTLYVTESDLEYALSLSSTNPADYRTNITRVSLDGTATRLLTTTAILTQTLLPPRIALQFWSYSGLAAGPDGRLYVGNELAGQHIYTTSVISTIPFSVHLFSGASVYWAFTTTVPATRTAFTDDALLIPEGLRFGADGTWPLYVAEEDAGSGLGRVSAVQANGTHAPFCTGFETIEDVIWDATGNLFISEDTTGLIIRVAPPPPPPPPSWLYLPLIVR